MLEKEKNFISEFVNKIQNKSEDYVLLFFKNEEYKNLKSYEKNLNISLLKEYVKEFLNIELESIKENDKEHPKSYVTLIPIDSSYSKIGSIERHPIYLNVNIDDILLNSRHFKNSRFHFHKIINNINNDFHIIDFVYYVFIDDNSLTYFLDYDYEKIDKKDYIIYIEFLNSIEKFYLDKNILTKIKDIKELLGNE